MEITSLKSIWPLCSFLLVLVALSSIPETNSMQGPGITKLQSLPRKKTLSPEQIPWGQGSYLVSQPKETFIAGFYPVGFNAYAFAVWYAHQNTTVVWMANRDYPVNGWESSLTLRKDGNLVLSDANKALVWQSNTGKSDNVAELVLQDTGNLALVNTRGNTVWQSFDHPTDTLLPGQFLQLSPDLASRFSNSSYRTGYYRLFFGSSNILTLSINGTDYSADYWPGVNSGRSQFSGIPTAGMDERGNFHSTDGYSFNTSDFGETPLRRLTLDPDGNLRAYSWDGNSLQWNIVWEAFTQLCTIFGLCGKNSLCIDTNTQNPHCACISGFRMANRSNWFAGCDPIHPIKPGEYNISSKLKLLSLKHSDFYGNDLDTYDNYQTLEQCREICMTDSRCVAFAYRLDGQGKCYPKSVLFNGRQSANTANTVYIKVPLNFRYNSSKESLTCSPPTSRPVEIHPSKPSISGLWNLSLGILFAIAVLEVACFGLGWWYLFKRYGMSSFLGIQGLTTGPQRFSFAELETATNNFSEIIGKGGFGTVYKGILSSNREVAVKKLQGVDRGEVQFRAEVTIVGRIHHMNLVRMLGFCAEGEHRMLVYEYIPNGSLDSYLFSEDKNVLQWNQRYAVALGMARGIAYLHEECLDWVLHCDIKPQNILLDDNFVPKVSDFGLAKLVDRERTLCFSTIRGTRGYLAPEWVRNLPITAKADVYSFGIVLLEIVRGQNSAMFTHHTVMEGAGRRAGDHFPRPAVEQTKTGKMRDMLDPKLAGDVDSTIDWEEVERVVRTALWCIQYDQDLRPSMGRVVEMLQGTVEVPNIFDDAEYLRDSDHSSFMRTSSMSLE